MASARFLNSSPKSNGSATTRLNYGSTSDDPMTLQHDEENIGDQTGTSSPSTPGRWARRPAEISPLISCRRNHRDKLDDIPTLSGFGPLVRNLSSDVGSITDRGVSKFAPVESGPFQSQDPISFSKLKPNDSSQILPKSAKSNSSEPEEKGGFLFYIIYALVNSIMCIPCLYGYAAVIFNNAMFQPEINALSKLVIWSSAIHQICFCIFSTLPFSIGQVQDAGLIFLSAMSNRIADTIVEEGGTIEEAISTTVVLLALSTASLGFVLVVMGKFRIADIVAYLPLPVVGGYLAFIGYFCLEAGIGLCISKSMMNLVDWANLFDYHALLLAAPGIGSGLVLTYIARFSQNDAALPLAMVVIPALFYMLLFGLGMDLQDARNGGWVGEVAPSVPVTDLFDLIDFNKVRWDLAPQLFPIWAGMVFVVSFASCLDVAAISMDMGEALDVNAELMTVGISNFVSGMTVGFTGSYIFSQTIFTYRTGCKSRWIGILVALSFFAVVWSTVNVLQVTPLFFLGSTLIFIGFDLLYEWVIEIRHKLLLSEYCVLLVTFAAIQFMGIDGGIFLGVIIAVADYVFTNARASSMSRVHKRSRAVWKPEEWRQLQEHGYTINHPKIMTLEVKGSVFFGSSLQLLNAITEEIGIHAHLSERVEISQETPRHVRVNSSPLPPEYHGKNNLKARRNQRIQEKSSTGSKSFQPSPSNFARPRFVVLDLNQVPNLDASACRGCFLQLANMCAKRGIVLCTSGCSPRVEWMLRSHDVAYDAEEEAAIRDGSLHADSLHTQLKCEKIIIFGTLYEALEFCEFKLIGELGVNYADPDPRNPYIRTNILPPSRKKNKSRLSLSSVFSHYLALDEFDARLLEELENHGESFHQELNLQAGESVFTVDDQSDAFFVVLSGSVTICQNELINKNATQSFASGAGSVIISKENSVIGQGGAILNVGSIFGFVDFILERPRHFSVMVSTKDSITVIAKIHRSGLARLKATNPAFDRMVDKVLLQASVLELANVSNR